MNETLQQKIDGIEHKLFIDDEYSQHHMILDVSKALQEFREQIDMLYERNIADEKLSSQFNIALDRVLALIGEKNEL